MLAHAAERRTSSADPAFLTVADTVGCRLARDAIWSGDRCTWMAWSVEPGPGGGFRTVRRSAGLALYDGIAGVALFLTYLVRATGDAEHRAVRDGAIRHLVCRTDRASAHEPGFYGGLLGAAWALARIGELLSADELVAHGIATAHRAIAAEMRPDALDVLGGRAGAVVALIDMASRFEQPALLEGARRCGDELLAGARRSAAGTSWATFPPAFVSRDLLGYSHGVAGIALALLELRGATGDDRYAGAACDALRYERSHYSAAARNWPDFRIQPGVAAPPGGAFMNAWCHGALGIGLSRLRMFELLPSDREALRDEIDVALENALAAVRAQLNAPVLADVSPCHGTGAALELVLACADAFGRDDLRSFGESAAHEIASRLDEPGAPLPGGIAGSGGGETPGLLNGVAGIGYTFLRVFDANGVPSILVHVPATRSSPTDPPRTREEAQR